MELSECLQGHQADLLTLLTTCLQAFYGLPPVLNTKPSTPLTQLNMMLPID